MKTFLKKSTFALYNLNMKKEIIVLIGGPGSGKTSLINALIKKGYVCYPEISREIIKEAQKKGIDQLFLENPLLFSELLLEGRVKQYQDAKKSDKNIVFIDRGLPDVLAYMHYIGDSYPEIFRETCKNYIYTKVFVLPPWKEIYVSDKERYETYEQAVLIHEHLKETYEFYGYQLIEVPKDTIANRMIFIENLLLN